MESGSFVKSLLLLLGFSLACVAGAQSVLGAPPAWAAGASAIPYLDPPGAESAPEMDLLAEGFFTRRKAGHLFIELEQWRFGYRSAHGVIAVWHKDAATRAEVLLGGIETGLDRLIFVGLSQPGVFFPGFDRALIWSGFDADGVQKIGACPFQSSGFDKSIVVNAPVISDSGGVWVHASFLADGIALIDGVHSTVRWVDHQMNLHPEIAIAIPIDLRYETTSIVMNFEGEIELETHPSMGLVVTKRVIDPVKKRVVRVQIWPHEDSLRAAIDDPVAFRPVAGATLVQALVEILPSATGLVVEAAPAENGPWVAISAPERRPPSEWSVLIPLHRSLTENEWIRVRDFGANLVGETRQVRAAQIVLYQESLIHAPTVTRGKTLTLNGANLAHEGVSPAVKSAFGDWKVVSHSATAVTVETPLLHPLGKTRLFLQHSLGRAMVDVLVQ